MKKKEKKRNEMTFCRVAIAHTDLSKKDIIENNRKKYKKAHISAHTFQTASLNVAVFIGAKQCAAKPVTDLYSIMTQLEALR